MPAASSAKVDRVIRDHAAETASRVKRGIDGLAALGVAFRYFANPEHERPELVAAADRVLAGVKLTSAALIEFLRTCEREREAAGGAAAV